MILDYGGDARRNCGNRRMPAPPRRNRTDRQPNGVAVHGTQNPHGVAVDNSGTVYVTDSNRNQVAPASASPDLLPQAISQHARPEK